MATDSEPYNTRGGIDLADLFRLIWFGRYFVLQFVILSAALGVAIALNLPNTYRSEAIFRPAGADELPAGAGVFAQFGALTGLNLGIGGSTNADLAVAILTSRPFLVEFTRRHGIVVPLIAGKGWNLSTGELILDKELFDPVAKRWIRAVEPPLTSAPADDEIFDRFMRILSVEQDVQSGFVDISVTFLSPVLAQQWLVAMIDDLNEQLRQRDIAMQERSIAYLTERLQENKLSGLDAELSGLLKTAIREHMLAKVREEYALETIAPPYLPVLKSGPNRALIAVAATALGGLVGVVALVLFHARTPPVAQPALIPLGWLRRAYLRLRRTGQRA